MLGRFGACLAVLSSIFVAAALPGTAVAHDPREHQRGEFSIRLTPEEVPGRGDRGGIGVAHLALDEARETACYVIKWRNLEGHVTAAHLHVGDDGENGPHAIDFFNNKHFDGRESTVGGCVRVTDGGHGTNLSAREKIRYIIDNPENFYVNIHSTKFKDGAIRGQLD